MNAFAYRDKVLDELRRESNASFSVVYRAMSEAAKANHEKDKNLDVEDVKRRIRAIIREQAVEAN
ncbi:hypothetical protein [Mesorhizobium sp. M7A.F.Ca.US.010.02.1.1]|uniref:hypothetical protein n=1 Tax=unclassified Mesorhizobium TaxID=325217 RepID=UPI000FD54E2E|nr:hypothetical protein [Mesorhizobium sp. M7A.F.Ca.US.010.02.1.1]RUW90623.1 hypothetical protein EOA19_19815 [Mesorhizobium sp. M7A.F.Ca.US.010.02.1.1]